MTHHISGFIGPTEHLKEKTKGLTSAVVVPLAQGFAFLPLDNDLYEEIYKVNRYPMKWLAKRLDEAPLVWIETDYFGGFGKQSAILWKDGKKKRFREVAMDSAIDKALKELGVVCENDNDEFDMLGLGKHRSNESWTGKEY